MEVVGSIYTEVSDRFQKGIIGGGISRCVKAEKHDLGVIMADVNVIGSLEAKFESTNRIYDVGGCSPTLSTMQGGNQEPKILEASQVLTPKRTEYGKQIRKAYESGRIHESRHNMTELQPREDDISNTLTTVQKDNLLLEKPLLLGGVGKENEFGSQYRQGNRVYSSDACAMQPVGNSGGNSYLYNVGYRIRKLTPRECGRLMGVSDEDITKMAAVNSNTQLYKQFGNSIVVDVMCAMFKNLNINQGDIV